MSALVCFPIVLLLWPGAGAVQAEAPATAAAPTWVRLTEHAAFSPRDTADEVVFQGKMWLSNGYYHGAKLSRDLWCTTDGQQWTLVNSSTPYDGYSQLAAYQDRLWAIKKSVWSSLDGVAWTKVADDTPFGGAGEAVVHNDRILSLTGGAFVWSTTDGLKWRRLGSAGFGSRSAAGVVLLDGKIWILGGRIDKPNAPPEKGYPKMTTLNDVWSSTDGVQWTCATEHAPWAPRMWPGAQAYAGRLWVLGGFDNVHHRNLGDVWTSTDGRRWEQFHAKETFCPRHEPSCYVYDGSLWMVAGNSWPVLNDVWRLTLPGALP